MTGNPYKGLADFQFWSRAMAWPAPGLIDPMVESRTIASGDRIVTMGSCFAQHLARNLAGLGLTHYVSEPAPDGISMEEAQRRNFGVYSARFGNVYTVRQAVQLFQRAFGTFEPESDVWEIEGRFVDAFRPQIEPEPHASAEAVRAEARQHLGCVRRMFETADWIILTLGLTEAWRSKKDGAVYPVAPGVYAGSYDANLFEFVNFGVESVQHDLSKLIDYIYQVRPSCRIILTVSPVPLIATYEKQHVWAATTYSKAVLRVAAGEAEQRYPQVTYFPSYEIITSPAAAGAYYADDLRSVRDIGVKHVMRVFRKHFVLGEATVATPASRIGAPPDISSMGESNSKVICDEDLIEQAMQLSGIGST